ncbi:MAG TPA: protein translocase subunit SecD, partial [Jatrophihabitans sp.]|nr:protein translocase subunit SecD [Jatrophihabitans sp.]
MAPPPGTLRVGRYFLALFGLMVVLYSLIVFPGQRHTPKLGIDLVGGLRVVFTALTPKGAPPPSSSQMSQARQILSDRINTYGVTGATVVVQGSDQLVVEIPNGTGADVAKLGKAAVLNFRGVMAPAQLITCGRTATGPSGSASGSATGSASPSGGAANSPSSPGSTKSTRDHSHRLLTAPSGTASTTPTAAASRTATGPATGAATSPASPSNAAPAAPKCTGDPFGALMKSDPTLKTLLTQSLSNTQALNAETCPSPSMPTVNGKPASCHAYSALSATQQQEVLAALRNFDCNSASVEADIPSSYYIACDTTNSYAFLLSHVAVRGQQVSSASAQAPSTGVGGSVDWTVNLTLTNSGGNSWHAWTSKYNFPQANTTNVTPLQPPTSTTPVCGPSATLPCSDFVAFTLDGQAISYPVTLAVLDTRTQVSGNFTQTTANELARELNYGKLPLNFRAEQNQKVSATLGSTQLKAAFIAGGIGLALVIIYSLLYYRALGLVTIASLLVSGALTYAMLVILSTQIGFTLDLAGIAGFIVALGITADSFVVFFERIKDEVHEGRSLRVAVPRAWVRARRTVLSADTVSFLAAAILYYFASADVKGFAFTLGMSTILDLVVVFLFTHPIVSLLSRMRSFGSARFTGLSSVRVGGIA